MKNKILIFTALVISNSAFARVANELSTFTSMQNSREKIEVYTCNNEVNVYWSISDGSEAPFDLSGILPSDAIENQYSVKVSGLNYRGVNEVTYLQLQQSVGANGVPFTTASFAGFDTYQLNSTLVNPYCP